MNFRERMILTFGVMAGMLAMLSVTLLAIGQPMGATFAMAVAWVLGWFGTTTPNQPNR